jgi:MFS family permease
MGIGFVLGLLGSAVVTIAHPSPSVRLFLLALSIAVLQAFMCGALPAALFAALGNRLKHLDRLRRAVFATSTVLALSLCATLLTGAVFAAFGLFSSARELAVRILPGAAVTFAIAVLVGISVLSYDRAREARRHSEHLALQARLASLESRVRPHFLFNSLNAALALVPDDAPAAERVLERLAGLLRASLDADPTVAVPLRREMALVIDYLEVERVRFGDRLRFCVDVPTGLQRALVPSFAIQTLVENSVKHAVSASPSGASVRVLARREGDDLVVTVADDGAGLDDAAIVPGHGLHLLRERLAALWRDRASLSVGRGSQGGGLVTVILPLHEEDP